MEVPDSIRAALCLPPLADHLTHGICPECLTAHYPAFAAADARDRSRSKVTHAA